MGRSMVKVSHEEMQKLKRLAEIVKNGNLPLSERRIAKSKYEAIIKFAKNNARSLLSSI